MNTSAQRLLYIVQLSEFLSDSDAFHSALYLCSLWKFFSCYTVARLQLTLWLFLGSEEECDTLVSPSVQQESIFASLKQRDCYTVGSTKQFRTSKVRSGHR